MDVLFQYQNRSDLNSTEILHAMSYGKPLPHPRAMMHLRKGMQMIHIELLYAGRSVELWLQEHAFDPDTPVKLIWERGFDWQNALREVETKPVDWNPEIEQRNKHMQETARRIREEQGDFAAEEWPETMKPGGA